MEDIKLKPAHFAGIAAVNVSCPQCGELCVSETGSQQIAIGTERVRCEFCLKTFSLPVKAMKLLMNI